MSPTEESNNLSEPEWLSDIIDRTKISLTGTPPRPRAAVLAHDDFSALVDTVYLLGAALYAEYVFIMTCGECPDCRMQMDASDDDCPRACPVHERHWMDVVQLKRAALAVWLAGVNHDGADDD